MCHGAQGRGDGSVTAYFQREGAPAPVDFASDRVKGRNEGQLFWVLTNGLGAMPPFGSLLTAEERWTLVYFVQSVGGGR